MLDKVSNELKSLEGGSLIVFDRDMDGVSSGILMKIILEKLGIEVRGKERESNLDIYLIEKWIKKDTKNIIIVDSPFSNQSLTDFARKWKDLKIIYIDHHKTEKPRKIPNNLIFFDARVEGLYPKSTTEIVYMIGKRIFGEDFKKYSLIGVIGSFGDWMLNKDSELYKDFVEKYPFLIKNGFFTPPFVTLVSLIQNSDYEKLFNLPIEFWDSPYKLFKEFKKLGVVKKLKETLKWFSEIEVLYEDERIIVLKSKKASVVATTLSGFLNSKDIIAVVGDRNGFIRRYILRRDDITISLRKGRENNLDLGIIARNFDKKINGGGHPEAAGLRIKKKYLDDFIEYLKGIFKNDF